MFCVEVAEAKRRHDTRASIIELLKEESSDMAVVSRPVDLRQNNAHACERGTEREAKVSASSVA